MVDRGGAENQLSHPRDPCSHELIFRRGQRQIFILQVLPLGSVELPCAHPILPGSQSGLLVAGEQCWGGAIQRGAQSSCHHCCKKPHVLLLFIQGEGGIRLDISGITDFGESIEGGDEACFGRAHLRPDTHCDDHRYTAKWKWGQLRDTRGSPHLAKTAPMPRCCSRCQALAIKRLLAQRGKRKPISQAV